MPPTYLVNNAVEQTGAGLGQEEGQGIGVASVTEQEAGATAKPQMWLKQTNSDQ
jgi:hypothetical protein